MTDEVEWRTEIAEVQADDVIIRGHRLSELVGTVSFAEMVSLVLTGRLPTPGAAKMIDAVLVSLVDHGIVPSSIITRTLVSCGTPIQAAIAGGALSIADYHGGAGEALARVLVEVVEDAGGDDARLHELCVQTVARYRRAGRRFEGFGHPQHGEGDPRAVQLSELAREWGVAGPHLRALEILGEVLTQSLKRPMRANINGALAAIMMDLGFPWEAVRGLVIAPRTVGLTAHVVEELAQGNRWRHAPAERIEYTGPYPEADAVAVDTAKQSPLELSVVMNGCS